MRTYFLIADITYHIKNDPLPYGEATIWYERDKWYHRTDNDRIAFQVMVCPIDHRNTQFGFEDVKQHLYTTPDYNHRGFDNQNIIRQKYWEHRAALLKMFQHNCELLHRDSVDIVFYVAEVEIDNKSNYDLINLSLLNHATVNKDEIL